VTFNVIAGCAVAPALSVLTATGFVNGKRQFSTPYRIDIRQPITKKFATGDYVGHPYSCAKFAAQPSMGLLGEWMKYNQNFIYLYSPFWRNSPTIDGFWRMIAQMMRTRARMCLLWFR